ncbi:hypothetical protein [[Flexibacter] sp. ATCC 35208]|uniref:hypothetical protein n=1 Tax=[Flexibacter] sp. ATCC 35208 TaxID=1936242 RepID=UPI0009C65DF4|nr:hypothetical protein [[Flexibacter] sp. ATCC 35208]OMP81200.1 hypothetical protein BW716_01050 [[Flexibacter] sp. ATCC 35208]
MMIELNDDNSVSNYFKSARLGINSIATLFDRHEKEIPVYDEHVQLADLVSNPEAVLPVYTLTGNIFKRGELYIYMKDNSLLPAWDKHDLILLKSVDQAVLVAGDKYYFVLEDKRELAGVLTHDETHFIITPDNEEYDKEWLKPCAVLKMYKIMGGLKKEEALREREKKG